MAETFGKPNISAVECVHALLDDIENSNHTAITELARISYVRLALLLCPGVKTIVPSPDQVYYEVTDKAAREISIAAVGNIEAYDMLVEICRSNVMSGKTVPEPMRANCFQLISGEWKGPRKRGARPRQNFGFFFIAYHICRYLSDAYQIPKVRGDGYDENSAADIVSTALSERGLDASYTKIRDFLTHGDHEQSRKIADWVTEMLYEPYLADLGLIRRRRVFSFSPFGLFLPIPRITE